MSLYEKITLAQIPSGYKASTLYSVIPANGDGDFDFTRGSTATRVNKDGLIETVGENVPRLDYTNSECPILLLEPQRTNYLLNSNNASLWSTFTSSGTITRTANYSTAPDGTLTATRMQASVTGSGYALLYTPTAGISGSYVSSVYVKSNTGVSQEVAFYGVASTLTNYTITNEWQRLDILDTTSGTAYFLLGIQTDFSGYSNPIDISVWGGQIEAGTYPTSYISTTGSAVTRTVDVSKKENFADMPTDYPFTVYSNNKVDLINGNQWAWSILDVSSAVKYLGLAFTNSGYIQLHRRNSNNDIDSITTTVTQGQDFKFAITFLSDTSYRYSINGSATVTVTGGAIVDFDFNDILIGQQRVVADTGYRNTSNDFRILNENVTSSELTELTS